jgi:hypothetical protein
MTTLTTTWWTDRRVRWSVLVAAVLLLAYVELLWIDAFPVGHHHTGDTNNLIAGARSALDCIDQGIWRHCGHVPGNPGSGVFPYALLQYLPAMFAVWLGASDAAVLGFLARINVLAFAGCLGLIAWTLRAHARLAALGVLAVLGSVITYQATSGFGEMLAAAVVVAAVASVRSRRPVLMAMAFLVACTAKETIAPFVLLFGLLVARPPGSWMPERRVKYPLFAGCVAGILLNIGFNQFRFGSFRNLNYTQSFMQTPGIRLKVEILFGEWFSPVVGLFWIWPVASFLVTAVLVIGLIRLAINRRDIQSWLPPLLAGGVLVGFTVGLTAWYAPFGWIAYGHRLAVPAIPAAVLVILLVAPEPFNLFFARIGGKFGLAFAVISVLVAVSLPQTFAAWTWRQALAETSAESTDCSGPIYIDKTPDLYFDCLLDVIWTPGLEVRRAAYGGDEVPNSARVLSGATLLALALVVVQPLWSTAQRSEEEDVPASRLTANDTD